MSAPRPILPQKLTGALVLLAVLALSLAACAEQFRQTPAVTSQVTPTRTLPPPARRTATALPKPSSTPTLAPIDLGDVRGLTLQVWHPADPQALNALAILFNAQNPWGLRVQMHAQPGSGGLQAALETLAPPDRPDVALGFPDQVANWQADGWVTSLDSYLNHPQVGLSAAQQEDFLALFFPTHPDGHHSIPLQGSLSLLLVNQTWAEELGYSAAPQTAAAFRTQACAANRSLRQDADVTNDGRGGWLGREQVGMLLGWMTAYQVQLEPTSAGYRFNTPLMEDLLGDLKTTIDANCAWISAQPFPDELFAARQALFTTAEIGELPYIAEAFAWADNQDSWTVTAFPGPDGQQALLSTHLDGALLSISAERQLASWLFLSWLSSPEVQAEWTRRAGGVPVRQSAFDLLDEYAAQNPQWQAAIDLLPLARPEPRQASWSEVQWVLNDVGIQLFRSYFEAERIPDTLIELQRTVDEVTSD